jgi:tetratricopeptide (TPR) repeat protein
MDFGTIYNIQLLIDREKFDTAYEKINGLLTEYPDSDDLYMMLAELYLRKEEFRKAKAAVDKGIALNPENSTLFFQMARIQIQKEEFKAAEQNIDLAIALDPEEAQFYGLKAQIYINYKSYNDAVRYAKQGLRLNPDDLMCNNMLSMALIRMGKQGAAKNTLEGMLSGNPEDAFTQANMGYMYLSRNDIPKAKEHFAVALQSDPNMEFARSGMAEAIKGSNFLYAKLLQFSFWMQKMSSANKWAMYLGVFVILKLIPILLPFYLVILLWSWFTAPVSDVVLYFDRYGRYLMNGLTIKLTELNIGLLGLSLVSLVLGFTLHESFFVLAFGLILTVLPVYRYDLSVRAARRLTNIGFGLLFTLTGIYSIYAGYVMGKEDGLMVLILGAVAFSWVAAAQD